MVNTLTEQLGMPVILSRLLPNNERQQIEPASAGVDRRTDNQ
ncbi:MAG TPA: hypothetical protein PKN13_09485 [Accumulibacter sp.]|nr:hypothetical protein [Accumulibacter sp.]HNM75555.1 hypothetical protein [Accumulibacter sp.]